MRSSVYFTLLYKRLAALTTALWLMEQSSILSVKLNCPVALLDWATAHGCETGLLSNAIPLRDLWSRSLGNQPPSASVPQGEKIPEGNGTQMTKQTTEPNLTPTPTPTPTQPK